MRLLHIVPTYLPAVRYGGPIQSVHGLCAALAKRGHDVHVFTTNVDGSSDSAVPLGRPVDIDGVNVWYFPSRRLRRLYWAPSMARALKRDVRTFDLLHVHSVFLWPTWAASRAARAAGIPYVLSPRGMLVRDLIRSRNRIAKTAWMTLIERVNLAHAAAIHVTSAIESADVRDLGCRLGGRIFEVPNGVALAPVIRGTGASIRSEQRSESPYLLILGRISWKKRIELAFEALSLVDGIRLVIAGGDDEGMMVALQERARSLGVLERVEFVGPVGGERKGSLLRGAMALLMPSLSENFGNAVLEAMAEGTPAIVVPQVGAADVVLKAGAGFVVAPSAEAIADAVRQLQRNPQMRIIMGARAQAALAAIYSWSAVGARMEEAYCALVPEHPGG